MSEAKSVFIDNVEYQFHHISVKKLNRILIKIIKIAGEPIANSIDKKVAEKARIDPEKAKEDIDLGKVIKALANSLEEDAVEQIVEGLLQGAVCVGKGAVNQHFEECFGHSLAHMWRVVFQAAKYYYADFLQGGLGFLSKEAI